jgi:hypothetical protein
VIHDFESAIKKLNKWKLLFMFSLLLPLLTYAAYTAYVVAFVPPQQQVLLNASGGVYSNEDLSTTNVSEGEIKQFTYKVISKSFTYNYRNFAHSERYLSYLSGGVEVDIPDHRELIAPYYRNATSKKLIKSLEDAPWMSRFYPQRRHLTVSFPVPPAKVKANGFVTTNDDVLNIEYKGHFFVFSNANSEKQDTYKVEYNISLERKPLIMDLQEDTYYFAPLVRPNTFEWRVKSFTWTEEKRA